MRKIVNVLFSPFKYFGRPTWAELIVAVCAIAALWQLNLLRETNKLTKDTAQKQLRAYVTAIKGEFEGLDEKDSTGSFIVNITIKNSGQTPSYETTIKDICIWQDSNRPKNQTQIDFPPFILASQNEMNIPFTFDNSNPKLPFDTHKILHVSGVVIYKDIYNIQHKSSFHFAWTENLLFSGNPVMTFGPEGNKAD